MSKPKSVARHERRAKSVQPRATRGRKKRPASPHDVQHAAQIEDDLHDIMAQFSETLDQLKNLEKKFLNAMYERAKMRELATALGGNFAVYVRPADEVWSGQYYDRSGYYGIVRSIVDEIQAARSTLQVGEKVVTPYYDGEHDVVRNVISVETRNEHGAKLSDPLVVLDGGDRCEHCQSIPGSPTTMWTSRSGLSQDWCLRVIELEVLRVRFAHARAVYDANQIVDTLGR